MGGLYYAHVASSGTAPVRRCRMVPVPNGTERLLQPSAGKQLIKLVVLVRYLKEDKLRSHVLRSRYDGCTGTLPPLAVW